MDARQRERFDRMTTWPLRVVVGKRDASKSLGVVMPRIPDRFFFDWKGLNLTERLPRELQFAIQDDEFARARGVQPLDSDTRYRLATRLARALTVLHERGIVYGDISMKNVVYDDLDGAMMLVDCDSALVAGTISPFEGRQPHTPGFVPPESARYLARRKAREREGADERELQRLTTDWARQSTQTDVYKFALVLVRLIDYGADRGNNCDPSVAASRLPGSLGSLLRESLSDDALGRPTMREWFRALNSGGTASSRKRPPELGWREVSPGRWERA